MNTYTHPQENWDEAKCAKMSRRAPKDHWGNRPPKGLIAGVSNPYPQYGQTRRYNGGITIEGTHYEAESIPLPLIPDTYEFVTLATWGTRIQPKS